MFPLAIDTTSCPGLCSTFLHVLAPFPFSLLPVSSFSTLCSFRTIFLAFPLMTIQAEKSSGEASITSSHVTTRNVAFRAGSLIIDSQALMGCSAIASEIGCVSLTAGDWCGGILGNLNKGSTLECTFPALCTMSKPGNAPNTVPHATNLLLVFLYIQAQTRAVWSVMTIFLSPSMKGWNFIRASLTPRALCSVVE